VEEETVWYNQTRRTQFRAELVKMRVKIDFEHEQTIRKLKKAWQTCRYKKRTVSDCRSVVLLTVTGMSTNQPSF